MNYSAPTIVLHRGKERSLLRRHPWIFSGAIDRVEGEPASGDVVRVLSGDGAFLGWASFSPESSIRARVMSFDENRPVTDDLVRERVTASIDYRSPLTHTDAIRLIFSESDQLPGLIVDRYGEFLVCQFLSAGIEPWREVVLDALEERLAPRGIYERSDADVREKEGLIPTTGTLRGEEPPPAIEIREGTVKFLVDVRKGHKTGFYLDQRENRTTLGLLSPGRTVLNCFAYTGGFGITAAAAGASMVTNIDVSSDALELASANARLNGIEPDRFTTVEADVFHKLREYRDRGLAFELIIMDPPKFAESRRHLDAACRGYKDINLLAIKLLVPGGILMTFSCSGAIELPLFQKVVADAALDAGRHGRILRTLDQPADHPVSLTMPESRYLKGLVVQV
jgi:23S rRNA (cytosine1962-C5)-methyltransferase